MIGINKWPPSGRDIPVTATFAWRSGFVCAVGVGLGVAAFGIVRSRSMEVVDVVPEVYAELEWAAVAGWMLIGVCSIFACATHPHRRGVLLGTWLGLLASLAALRELDLQVLLNPGNIHLLGLEARQAVRFRFDWWMDASVSLALKGAWVAGLGSIAAAVILPFAFARYPWPRRLLHLDRWAVTTAAGFGLLLTAYVGDDLLAAGTISMLIEEILEVVGVVLLVASAALLAFQRVPLHGALMTQAERNKRVLEMKQAHA